MEDKWTYDALMRRVTEGVDQERLDLGSEAEIAAMLQVVTGDDLGSKMDKMLILQKETIELGEKKLRLTERTISTLEERLPPRE